MPLGTALLLQAFPASEQGMALGIFGIAALVAPAVGPILGGWLVDADLWRVIFFINPPIGLIGILLGTRYLRERYSGRRPSFDLAGIITGTVGFGSLLYAASIAADRGWTSPQTLTWFAVGGAGLIAFAVVELFVAKSPLLDLRLFGNRIFLNASLLGYVSTVALFGAEFLLPVYLQSLRGRTAFETGVILLPMAITGGIFVTLSGRLYDRIGPRPLMAAGFSLLVINTWQFSQIEADTSVSWIMFLLALRGMALGLTVQTTFVTALSVVPVRDLPRGSSLTNSTRLVVQSIGVAVLATILAASISPEVQAWQQNGADGRLAGICEPVRVAVAEPLTPVDWTIDGAPQATGMAGRACRENILGFEHAYRVTFYAAFAALALGLMLPGWPAPWAGRRTVEGPASPH